MTTTEALLAMKAEDALRVRLDAVLKRPLNASALRLDGVREDAGTSTWVDCSLDRTKAPVDLWGLSGQKSFRYRRLDTTAFFQGIDKRVRVGFPVSAETAFRAFLSRWKIPLEGYEVVNDTTSSAGVLTVVPSSRSFRWFGHFDLTLELLTLDINDHVRASYFVPALTSDYGSDTVIGAMIDWLNTAPTNLLLEPVRRDMFEVTRVEENGRQDAADNSRLVMSFNGTPYQGSLEIVYSRRSFPKTYMYPVPISFTSGSTRDLTTLLSEKLGCRIVAEDLVDEPLPSIGTFNSELCLIQFDASSLGYIGEVWVEYTRLPTLMG